MNWEVFFIVLCCLGSVGSLLLAVAFWKIEELYTIYLGVVAILLMATAAGLSV